MSSCRATNANPMTTYGAIPTVYKGVQFRSRLEARWAAFFDLVGWPWEYEPIDLDGYVPDFVLGFHHPLLVEIKPAVQRSELERHTSKIEGSGWGGEALLLGSVVSMPSDYWEGGIGLLADRGWGLTQPVEDTYDWCWDGAIFVACGACHGLSIQHALQSYACRKCGANDGGWPSADPAQTWRAAGNLVQWKSPRKTPG